MSWSIVEHVGMIFQVKNLVFLVETKCCSSTEKAISVSTSHFLCNRITLRARKALRVTCQNAQKPCFYHRLQTTPLFSNLMRAVNRQPGFRPGTRRVFRRNTKTPISVQNMSEDHKQLISKQKRETSKRAVNRQPCFRTRGP